MCGGGVYRWLRWGAGGRGRVSGYIGQNQELSEASSGRAGFERQGKDGELRIGVWVGGWMDV